MTASPQPPAGSPASARPAPAAAAEAAHGGGSGGPRPSTLSFDVFFDTNPGKARDHNEDTLWAATPSHAASAARGYLFIVADGMGGHNAGEVASQAAVRGVYERFYADTEPDIRRSMENAIRRTNNELFNQAQANPAQHGMGTTLTAAVLRGNKLHVSHVGDSRLYLVRNGQPEQVTHDHSWVEEQVRAGVLTRLQAESHPQRNVITRALATGPDVRVDYEERELQPGDVIVICSDGLNTEVGDQQIASHATKATNAQDAVQRLIQLANDNGGDDNISVAVIRIGAPATGPIPIAGTGQEKKRKLPLAVLFGVLGALIVVGALFGTVVLPKLLSRQAAAPPPVVTDVAASTEVAPTVTSNMVGAAAETPAALSTESSQAPALSEATATAAPGVATSTPAPSPAVTATATQLTPTKSAVKTATRSSGIMVLTATPGQARATAPILASPLPNSAESGSVMFRWGAGGYQLRETEGYALLVWNANDPQYEGKTGFDLPSVFNACQEAYKQTERPVPLATMPGFGPGTYNWSVVVVDTAQRNWSGPCKVVSEQPGPYRFTLAEAAGPVPSTAPPCIGPACGGKPGGN